MIGLLRGVLASKQPPQVILDVNGVGYEVDVPMSTFYPLPATGESVTLLTQLIVREDAHLLFGFLTDAERTAFRQLLKVSGVGPKVALAILSGLSTAELSQAIVLQDAARLTRIPGIGKKTAERLCLELKGKLGAALPVGASGGVASGVGLSATSASVGAQSDIINALLALGYSEREALSAMKSLPPDISVSEGIRTALKSLAK